MKKITASFLGAVMAGILISVGGAVCMCCQNKIVGAFAFPVGLFTILAFKMSLFTGKVGYIFYGKTSFSELVTVWFGNLAGAVLTALALSATRVNAMLSENIRAAVDIKMNDTLLSLFILGIFCGLLVNIAVTVYNDTALSDFTKFASVFVCIAVFILSGHEHCVADMFYFAAAGSPTCDMLLRLVIITLGNVVGCNVLPAFRIGIDKLKKQTV